METNTYPKHMRALIAGAASRPTAIACIVLAAVVLAANAPAWATGRMFYELDTIKQNAPFLEYAAASMRGGELPLWNPYLANGLPQFAEGQTGALHPFHVLFLMAGAFDLLLVWGPVLRALAATLATYWLARTLHVSRPGAMLAALTYGLGGFLTAQQHHLNIANTAFVLPTVLAAWESAFATSQPGRRVAWLVGAGVALATSLLALHAQMVMITIWATGVWILASVGLRRWRSGGTHCGRTTLVWMCVGTGLMSLVAVGLSAIQTVPFLELVQQSGRSESLTTVEASRFSIPSLGLIQLIFPGVLGRQADFWFSWNAWESLVYTGLVPLVLAPMALRRPSRLTLSLAALAVLSGLVALGSQSPIPIGEAIDNLPGFDRTRAPGRFSMVLTLAIGLLGGVGLDSIRNRPSPRLTIGLTALVALSIAVLAITNYWLRTQPSALGTFNAWVAMQPDLVPMAPGIDRYDLAIASTDPRNLLTLLPSAAAVVALMTVAFVRQPLVGHLVVAIAAIELGSFAATFHPTAPLTTIFAPTPYAKFVPSGTYPRAFVSESIALGSNRLLVERRPETSAYTPLVPNRMRLLLEAWPRNPPRIASALGVATAVDLSDARHGHESHFDESDGLVYSINRPVLAIDRWSTAAEATVHLPQDDRSRELHLVTSLDLPNNHVVATARLLNGKKLISEHPIRTGQDVSERTGFGALQHRPPAHTMADVVATVGNRQSSIYTRTRIPLPTTGTASLVLLKVNVPGPRLTVHGAAVMNEAGTLTAVEIPEQVQVPADPPILVMPYEAGPRFALYSRIRLTTNAKESLDRMLLGMWEFPARPVVEAGPWGPSIHPDLLGPLPNTPTQIGTVTKIAEQPAALSFQTDATTPTILVLKDMVYPGWKAFVDGVATPILPANITARAIPLAAGTHRVDLRYEPQSLRIGLMTSGATGLILLASTAIAKLRRQQSAVIPKQISKGFR
ncbi:MAG TPA: hypothetical protein DGO43_02705 [Chloroflexi bacterium]|nr:hypothetical protein [Chloroflexota bacterium]